jgi:hypothetical protein
VQLPLGRITDPEPGFHALAFERVTSRQGAADALIHHGQAVADERLVIHRAYPMKNRRWVEISDGFPITHSATRPSRFWSICSFLPARMAKLKTASALHAPALEPFFLSRCHFQVGRAIALFAAAMIVATAT